MCQLRLLIGNIKPAVRLTIDRRDRTRTIGPLDGADLLRANPVRTPENGRRDSGVQVCCPTPS